MNPGLWCWEKRKPAQPRGSDAIASQSACQPFRGWMALGIRAKKVPCFPSPDSFAESLDSGASSCFPPKRGHKMGLGDREQHSYFSAGALGYCFCCRLSRFRRQMAPLALPLMCPLLGSAAGPQLSLSFCLPTACPAMLLHWLYQNWTSSECNAWLLPRPDCRQETEGLTHEKFRIKIFYYLANGCCFIHLAFPSCTPDYTLALCVTCRQLCWTENKEMNNITAWI